MQFRLCEPRRDEFAAQPGREAPRAYVPLAIGIEIVSDGQDLKVAPLFAVEMPVEMFPAQPIGGASARRDIDQEANDQRDGASPDTGLAPLAHKQVPGSAETLQASRFASFVPKNGASSRPDETSNGRRERLKNAPFVN